MPSFDHYFRHLCNIVKFVHQSDFLDKDAKKYYANFICGQLSTDELGLLFFFGLTDRGAEFKKLVEHYALFEDMPSEKLICEGTTFEELTSKEYRNLYDKSAYGESE